LASIKTIKIELESYAYQNKDLVLRDIYVSLKKGQIHTLIGPSGCGKSTFLRILMGMETGAIGHFGNNRFSMVPQIPHLFPWKTILENVMITGASKDKARESLVLVGLLDSQNKYPYEISLGMSQRVAFARALVQQSDVILLDEPFASLDAYTRKTLQKWLVSKISETNKYALLVTHDIHEAIEVSQNISILTQIPATIKSVFSRESDSFVDEQGTRISSDDLEELIFDLLRSV
jgi:ABC-type nitrate/sulfonate/bicarbonate transport system ATPase subunit